MKLDATIKRGEDGWFVTRDFAGVPVWGSGPTRLAAVVDYLGSLLDALKLLSDDEARLHPRMKQHLDAIRATLEEA